MKYKELTLDDVQIMPDKILTAEYAKAQIAYIDALQQMVLSSDAIEIRERRIAQGNINAINQTIAWSNWDKMRLEVERRKERSANVNRQRRSQR